jgi:hypothetical protein
VFVQMLLASLGAGVDLTGVFVLWGQNSLSLLSVQVLGLALQRIGGGFCNKVRRACIYLGSVVAQD